MNRQAYASLLEWKDSPTRKPLILKGARQVGKTTLLKLFAEQEFQNHLYLNFERTPALCQLFLEDLEPKRIIDTLSLYFDKTIHPKRTLLIFDEVQECPEALNSLKYFCESAPEYNVAAAGSLLGVKLANTKGFPVGKVDFIELHPMNFLEFLDAVDESKLKEYLLDIQQADPINTLLHEKLVKLFKYYCFVGGMPEAVFHYVKFGNLAEVRQKQLDILNAYELDFAKHAPKGDTIRISEVWASLPSQLAKENKKFIYTKIKSSARGRDYDTAIQWLVDAGLVHKVFNTSTPKLPLKGYVDMSAFKLYVLDTGLLGAMADISPKLLLEENTLFAQFNGLFIENSVAQALKHSYHDLYYWTSSGKAELDYLIHLDNNIIPIEVKSGNSRKKQSLRQYRQKYKPELSVIVSPANLKKEPALLNCPLYLMDRLVHMIKEI